MMQSAEMPLLVTSIGLLVGFMMAATACAVFLKHQTFGTGGSSLSVLGTILIGMSVWSNISVSIGPEGGIKADLTRIKEEVSAINTRSEELGTSLSHVQVQVEQTSENVKELRTALAGFQERSGLNPDGMFGPRTDYELRKRLRDMNAGPDDEEAIELVQGLTGKNRAEAQRYINDAIQQ